MWGENKTNVVIKKEPKYIFELMFSLYCPSPPLCEILNQIIRVYESGGLYKLTDRNCGEVKRELDAILKYCSYLKQREHGVHNVKEYSKSNTHSAFLISL